ncbi:branched-chain amino acid ABC transporter permease [Desulfatirhabdium butyrativorans]|uniref:branched-chain amino acid ABC transporter permease n=1 Tax=Desulfatirhabdium butyrativorans TaxID=340467 RepID=UPI0004225C88|nr:branched-chain amino acid ABC transporter permease [Desulfatirhabdium butyrativorans]
MRQHLTLVLYGILCLVILFLVQGDWINAYLQLVIMYVGINVILGTSLNLINGYMGEFSCGHAGFMAVGAYVSSILNMWWFTDGNLFGNALFGPKASLFLFPVTLLIAGAVAAVVGLLVAIPSFKTRGDYLAIITLAVNYIVKSAIENIQAIGGARGFMGMRKVVNAMTETVPLPWLMIWILVFTGLTVATLHRFVSSNYGKGIVAIREDEIAAEIMGVNTQRMKLIAFMLSSGLAGIAGGLFAHVLGYINPGSFTIMKSTEIMVIVYLGGMGSLSGSVMAAVLFTILLELMRPLQVLKWVLIPLMLIILMLFRPEGIMGNREILDVFPRLRRFFPAREA